MRKILHLLLAFMLVSSFFASSVFADEETDEKLSLVALGDSISFGYYPGMPVLVPQEFAFPELIKPDLFEVTNLAIPGWKAVDLLKAFDEQPIYNAALLDADLVTLNIGNNDLMQATGFHDLIQNPDDIDYGKVLEDLEGAMEILYVELNEIIDHIREHTEAPIILYNIYNPTVDNISLHGLVNTLVNMVNSEIFDNFHDLDEAIAVVDAFSAFDGNQYHYLFDMGDGKYDIHPSEEGHVALARIANEQLDDFLILRLTETSVDLKSATIDAKTNIAVKELKWMPGDVSLEEIKEDGTSFTDTEQFTVNRNGVYSVYAKSIFGQEKVDTIEVNSIVPDLVINPVLSTTDEDADSVTVTLRANNGIAAAYWHVGKLSLDDFNEEEWVEVEGESFTVTENGDYTIYVLDVTGQEQVIHITISNIVEETEKPEPEPEPEPKPEPAPEETDDETEDDDKDDKGKTEDDDDKDGTSPTIGKGKNDKEKLPKTATNNFNKLLVGFISMLTGFTVLIFTRKKATEPILL